MIELIGRKKTGTCLQITCNSRTGSDTGPTGLKIDDRPDRPKRRNRVQFNDKLELLTFIQQHSTTFTYLALAESTRSAQVFPVEICIGSEGGR